MLKHMPIRIAIPAPERIYHRSVKTKKRPTTYILCFSHNLVVNVQAMQISKNSTLPEPINQHFKNLNQREEHEKAQWEEVINIGDEFKNHRQRLSEILSKCKEMCDGHLGTIKMTTHRIKLPDDAKTCFQQPYPAATTPCEHEKKEIERMLKEEVIESSTSELAAPVVFAPKKGGTLHFCIDY